MDNSAFDPRTDPDYEQSFEDPSPEALQEMDRVEKAILDASGPMPREMGGIERSTGNSPGPLPVTPRQTTGGGRRQKPTTPTSLRLRQNPKRSARAINTGYNPNSPHSLRRQNDSPDNSLQNPAPVESKLPFPEDAKPSFRHSPNPSSGIPHPPGIHPNNMHYSGQFYYGHPPPNAMMQPYHQMPGINQHPTDQPQYPPQHYPPYSFPSQLYDPQVLPSEGPDPANSVFSRQYAPFPPVRMGSQRPSCEPTGNLSQEHRPGASEVNPTDLPPPPSQIAPFRSLSSQPAPEVTPSPLPPPSSQIVPIGSLSKQPAPDVTHSSLPLGVPSVRLQPPTPGEVPPPASQVTLTPFTSALLAPGPESSDPRPRSNHASGSADRESHMLYPRADKHSDIEDLDDDEEESISCLEESPTVGRLSNDRQVALKTGFKDLDALVGRISSKTGLTASQIVERWDVIKTRSVSSWNIYQSYFAERQEIELKRLPPHKRPERAPAGVGVVSAAYECFKAAVPDRYDRVLQSWYRLHQVSEIGGMSMGRREREFSRYADGLEHTIRNAAAMYSFHAIVLVVGGVVNQDQNLARVISSDCALDFFVDRYSSTDRKALGHMRAHVYDRMSRQMILEDAEDVAPEQPSPPTTTGTPSGVSGPVKSESTSTSIPNTCVAEVDFLREKFAAMGANVEVILMAQKSLKWKNMLHLFAEAGYIVINWPDGVTFPCDDKKGKGISGLTNQDRSLLIAAFNDPINPLGVQKVSDEAVPSSEPAAIGAPPPSDSPYAFGRRKFLDKSLSEDRKGLPRLPPATESGTKRIDARLHPPAATKPGTKKADAPPRPPAATKIRQRRETATRTKKKASAPKGKQAKSRESSSNDSDDIPLQNNVDDNDYVPKGLQLPGRILRSETRTLPPEERHVSVNDLIERHKSTIGKDSKTVSNTDSDGVPKDDASSTHQNSSVGVGADSPDTLPDSTRLPSESLSSRTSRKRHSAADSEAIDKVSQDLFGPSKRARRDYGEATSDRDSAPVTSLTVKRDDARTVRGVIPPTSSHPIAQHASHSHDTSRQQDSQGYTEAPPEAARAAPTPYANYPPQWHGPYPPGQTSYPHPYPPPDVYPTSYPRPPDWSAHPGSGWVQHEDRLAPGTDKSPNPPPTSYPPPNWSAHPGSGWVQQGDRPGPVTDKTSKPPQSNASYPPPFGYGPPGNWSRPPPVHPGIPMYHEPYGQYHEPPRAGAPPSHWRQHSNQAESSTRSNFNHGDNTLNSEQQRDNIEGS